MIDDQISAMCAASGINVLECHHAPDRRMSLRHATFSTERNPYRLIILVDENERCVNFSIIHDMITPKAKRDQQIAAISLLNNLLFCSRFGLVELDGQLLVQAMASLRVADSNPTITQLTDTCANAAMDLDDYIEYFKIVASDHGNFASAYARLQSDIPGFDQALVFVG